MKSGSALWFAAEPTVSAGVVRPRINRNLAEILAADVDSACRYLEEHGGTATPPKRHDHSRISLAKC